jgi:hypothetical protein
MTPQHTSTRSQDFRDVIQRTCPRTEAQYLLVMRVHSKTGEPAMKKLLGAVALLTILAAQAFSYSAIACTGTYAGYPCSQWNKMQDRW